MKNKHTLPETVIGIDLGDRKHMICVLDKHGKILREDTLTNDRQHLAELAREYPGARVAMEVGTHSPWISRFLAKAGLEVFVANARKLRAIYANERKCDELDARMLARIARLDPALLSPVRHGTEENQRDLLPIKLRDTLVRQRVAIINSVRACLKALGLRIASAGPTSFARQTRAALEEQSDLLTALAPALAILDELCTRIREYDKAITQCAVARHPRACQLQAIAGVGPITSLSFVLTIEDPQRFEDPRDVGAYLGLVPRRDQSGKSDKQLPISKTGNRYLRGLLVQSAQYILGHFGPECDLRSHGLKLASRGGKAAKKKAVIAVARKLAVVMLAMWKNQSDYRPLRQPEPASESLAA
jgi:transposase